MVTKTKTKTLRLNKNKNPQPNYISALLVGTYITCVYILNFFVVYKLGRC